jgi:hypothetical protein
MLKDCVTGVAALKLALPAWLAVMEHVPTFSSVTVAFVTEQTVGDSRRTEREG